MSTILNINETMLRMRRAAIKMVFPVVELESLCRLIYMVDCAVLRAINIITPTRKRLAKSDVD